MLHESAPNARNPWRLSSPARLSYDLIDSSNSFQPAGLMPAQCFSTRALAIERRSVRPSPLLWHLSSPEKLPHNPTDLSRVSTCGIHIYSAQRLRHSKCRRLHSRSMSLIQTEGIHACSVSCRPRDCSTTRLISATSQPARLTSTASSASARAHAAASTPLMIHELRS